MDDLVLTGIAVYPLKSGAGIDLDASDVERYGLRGDRRWMAIDAGGVCVTARERPQLVRGYRPGSPAPASGSRCTAESHSPCGIRMPALA